MSKNGLLIVTICAVPVVFSLPWASDPFGQTEEAVNATVWAMGGRNIWEMGFFASQRGAVTTPYEGSGEGIYAHHPPLPVWTTALIQAFTDREVAFRLVALAVLAAALFVLYRCLRLLFETPAARLGVVAAATSGYALLYGRLLTTLTLCTLLFVSMFYYALRRGVKGQPWDWRLLALIPLAVFSSWDGVIGTFFIVVFLFVVEARTKTWRILLPGAVALASVALLLWHLVSANKGFHELLTQLVYRSGAVEFSMKAWWVVQWGYVREGLGLVTLLLATAGAVAWLRKDWRIVAYAFVVATPGLGMLFGFRHGSFYHAFWAYNLILPSALLIAALHTRFKQLAPVWLCMVLLQASWNARLAGESLHSERILNANGGILRDHADVFREPVAVLSGYRFHPYVGWYTHQPMNLALGAGDIKNFLASGAWKPDSPVFADSLQAQIMGCAPMRSTFASESRWIVVPAATLAQACHVQ